MSTPDEHSHILNVSQERAVADLRNTLVRAVSKIAGIARSVEKTEPFTLSFYHKPRYSNSFGILGPRGAGKSTVLNEFYRKLLTGNEAILCDRPDDSADEIKLRILPPLDCSVLTSEILPGAAVLMQLYRTLQKKKTRNEPREGGPVEEIRTLIGHYTRIERNYYDLCLDLSSSPDDYGEYVFTGLQERLSLGEKLAAWLDMMLDHLRLDAFVVLLDDFDLVQAEEVRRWFIALLDELHQARMFFVLTADFYRLDHLSLDPKAQFDDKTGRALLFKLLPLHNRVTLERWDGKSQPEFKPTRDYERSLWQLATETMGDIGNLEHLVLSLLPQWPRGLINLYESLESSNAASKRADSKSDSRTLRSFLSQLATSRGEPLLARRLGDLDEEEWARTLSFEGQELEGEEWQTTIEAARTRPNPPKGKRLAPLRGLTPVPTATDLKRRVPILQRAADAQQPMAAPLEGLDSWSHDPSWHDPLRHERLRVHPLRDAADADQELWAELLINRGLEKSARHRVAFLSRWPPAVSRLAGCQFSVEFLPRTLRAFFEDNTATLSGDVLSWLRRSDAGKIEIGWTPLAEALHEARDSWSTELLKELLVDVSKLRHDRSNVESTPSDPHDILPGELWALVLLVDALSRCPWTPLSTSLGWQVTTYLSLAAAFVRSAYVDALVESGQIGASQLAKKQRRFLSMLRRKDPAALLGRHEEEILQTIHCMFHDDLTNLLEDKDALSRAAHAYLSSPAYRAVVDLLAAQPEVAEASAAGSAS